MYSRGTTPATREVWITAADGSSDQLVTAGYNPRLSPNGRYLLRVVASDSPSNSPATALSGAFESQTFDIDNAPPVLAVTSVRRDGPRTVIAFDARDEHSAIQRAEYSLDGERWDPAWSGSGALPAFEAAIENPRTVALPFVFPPRAARYVKFTQTATELVHYWSIAELRIVGR